MPPSTAPAVVPRSPIAYGLATIFVLGLLLAAWLMRTHETALETAVASNRAAARAYAANVGRLIESVDANNRVILGWNSSDSAGMTTLLHAINAVAPHYLNLLLLDADGSVVNWSGDGPPPDLPERLRDRARLAAPGNPVFIDELRSSRVDRGRSYVSVARARRSADGSIERIAVAILDARTFEHELRAFAGEPGSSTALNHRNGTRIAHSSEATTPGWAAAVPPGSGLRSGPGDEAMLGWIEPVAPHPLAVVVETDRAVALGAWRDRAVAALLFFALGAAVILTLSIRQARQAKDLAEAEHRYRALTEQSLVGIFLMRDEQLLYANPRLAEILGADPARFASRDDVLGFINVADRERIAGYLVRWQDDAGAAGTARFAAAAADGSTLDLEMQGRQVVIDGRPAALIVVSDTTDQAHARRELQAMAYHDALTGLPNRALMFDRLTQTLARTQRTGSRFALMLIDLDGFKEVNDTLGHEAGDGVLRAVADRLLASLRESDTVARMGGDEFLVILATTPGTADAESVARKLLAELARPIPLRLSHDPNAEPAQALVSGSIGLAFYPDHGETTDALIAAADSAMYLAKNAGKNRYATAAMPVERAATRRGPFIAWTPEFMVGIDDLDSDHSELFIRVNDLAAAIRDGDPPTQRDAALEALRARTAEHFRDEEGQMLAAGYAGAEGHQRQHRELLRKLTTLEHLLDEHGPSMALKTLRDWLLLHINTADRQFAAYLRHRQSEAAAPPAD